MYHNNPTVDAMMKRGYLFLEDHEWKSANEYFNKVLDIDPENAQAYIGSLLAEMCIEKESDLYMVDGSLLENNNYKKAMRFADEEYQKKLQQYHLDSVYFHANNLFKKATHEESHKFVGDIEKAKKMFVSIRGYKDSEQLIAKCDDIIAKITRQHDRNQTKKRTAVAICVAIVVALVSYILWSTVEANNERAEVIYQNFLGKTFAGEIEDDSGLYRDYMNNSLKEYMIYWMDREERSLSFETDGSIYYTVCSEFYPLAYPSNIPEPEGVYNNREGKYSSFKVRCTLKGDIYVDIAGSSYSVTVNSNNVPTKIYDYHGITLS